MCLANKEGKEQGHYRPASFWRLGPEQLGLGWMNSMSNGSLKHSLPPLLGFGRSIWEVFYNGPFRVKISMLVGLGSKVKE